jgi:hypothetical protein
MFVVVVFVEKCKIRKKVGKTRETTSTTRVARCSTYVALHVALV